MQNNKVTTFLLQFIIFIENSSFNNERVINGNIIALKTFPKNAIVIHQV